MYFFDIVKREVKDSFVFSSRRRHTRSKRDWSSDVCSSDLGKFRTASRAAQDDLLATQYARETVRTVISAQIAQTYFQLLATDAQLRLLLDTLQRDGFGTRLQRVLEQPELRVGREELEVGLRDLRADHRAHGLARVLRGQQVDLRGAARGAELAPQIDFVRSVHADAIIVVDRREAEQRNAPDLSHAAASGVYAEVDAR